MAHRRGPNSTSQDSGVQRCRPLSRKLSLTISQASSTISSLVTNLGPVSFICSCASSRHNSVEEEKDEGGEIGDSNATEVGRDVRRRSVRAPVMARTRIFCCHWGFKFLVLLVWKPFEDLECAALFWLIAGTVRAAELLQKNTLILCYSDAFRVLDRDNTARITK